MIDVSLVEKPVNGNDFNLLYEIDKPCLFIGHILKNEYDNQRLQLNDDYNPVKFFTIYSENGELKLLPLYGILRELNDEGKRLVKLLKGQENRGNINLIIYENIINQHDITCNDCYAYYKQHIYPIDFNKFRKLTDDEIATDKKILQHLLNLDESKFDFQKFGSILSLILT